MPSHRKCHENGIASVKSFSSSIVNVWKPQNIVCSMVYGLILCLHGVSFVKSNSHTHLYVVKEHELALNNYNENYSCIVWCLVNIELSVFQHFRFQSLSLMNSNDKLSIHL